MDESEFKKICKEQQIIHESIRPQNEASRELSDLSKLEILCEAIENDFENLDNDKLMQVLNNLNNNIEFELEANIECDIGTLISTLIDQYEDDSPAIKRIVQLIYQLLYKIPKRTDEQMDDCNLYGLNDEIFMKLINVLLSEVHDRVILTNALVCVQKRLRLKQSNTIMERLWLTIADGVNGEQSSIPQAYIQVLVQLFDEFVSCLPSFHTQSRLIKIIQCLISSDRRDERRAGGFLLKKIVDRLIAVTKSNDIGLDLSEMLSKRWTTYITILDNLEDNQSHLILPALDMLESGECQRDEWYKILLKLMLKHQNILVLRWSLEYILKKHNCVELDADILLLFMEAANRTSLYNRDGYFLPQDNLENFFKDNMNVFIELLGSVNWKSAPLHFWIRQIHFHTVRGNEFPGSFDSLLAIATRVRALQNFGIRRFTTEILEEIFSKLIANLTLAEYIIYIEAIYSSAYDSDKIFKYYMKKLEKYANSTKNLCGQRMYEIINAPLYLQSSSNKLCSILKRLPKETHGHLRFLIVFNVNNHSKEVTQFCSEMYNIDLLALQKLPLNELISELTDKLVMDQSEQRYVNEGALHFFIFHNVKSINQLTDKFDMSVESVLEGASILTVKILADLYEKSPQRMSTQIWTLFLQSFEKWKMNETALSLFKCIRKCETDETIQERAHDLFLINVNKVDLRKAASDIEHSEQFYVDNLMYGDIKTGDARIEELYECQLKADSSIYPISDNFERRKYYRNLIPERFKVSICKKLFQLNNELSFAKPRYYENSRVHILKMRIFYNIFELLPKLKITEFSISEEDLWSALLEQNNQLNITYLLENLIGRTASNANTIKEKLNQISIYTSSQQISIICIAFKYLGYRSFDDAESFYEKIFPLSMGDNFQVRLYAQLVSLSILKQKQKDNSMQASIRSAIGDKVDDLLEDIRLRTFYGANELLYVSNAPIDEYDFRSIKVEIYKYAIPKTIYTQKICNYAKPNIEKTTTTSAATIENNICNAQRKMNPINDIIMQSDLKLAQQDNNNVDIDEFYVIASLVDKLPNLGGIARTCEVFGIKNLVLNNKTIVEQNDFKHLSMTAEKSLNIIEVKAMELPDFLMQKQVEGFKIIGAEQTAESVTFVNFEFPKKCILLLGHEKEGIPPNLLGFLDAAVEIPQLGNVRSLNVHVTGALFMWEYCKQHIIKK